MSPDIHCQSARQADTGIVRTCAACCRVHASLFVFCWQRVRIRGVCSPCHFGLHGALRLIVDVKVKYVSCCVRTCLERPCIAADRRGVRTVALLSGRSDEDSRPGSALNSAVFPMGTTRSFVIFVARPKFRKILKNGAVGAGPAGGGGGGGAGPAPTASFLRILRNFGRATKITKLRVD